MAQKTETISLGGLPFAGDDAVVPFEVADLDARGRALQLGAALDSILERHNYPEPVSRLLAEAIVLTVLLGSSLKFEGKFIFQTRSDGPVDMLVCDFATPSAIRAYARFDETRLAEAVRGNRTSPEELLGKGTLALTVDQGAHMQRYQGIVALDGSSLEDIAHNYFQQSEQIPTQVKLAVAWLVERHSNGTQKESWRAGGLLAQFLPHSGTGGSGDEVARKTVREDHWREVLALTGTIESAELTDPLVGAERLLYRLFHEHGVRVFEPQKVEDQCSCSREKIRDVLSGFTTEEVAESTKDGRISVTCEFCSTTYDFDPKDFSNGE
ncbi:MAG: Hsp33 family chaperone [Candidatus Tokpelaia hoelldobleri]|uniref:Hsp33 family chaperone n=1 Tax=Candidatus Tokpelaia hoelldobleri TaxID=1902579 RepID=A0A1U9JVI8_9HYPH|nr:MAG: Hsp33 family chaperone [Candidatus Tokpelaia hoelldoblerii]